MRDRVEDDGTVHIYSNNPAGMARAPSRSSRNVQEIEINKIRRRRHDQGSTLRGSAARQGHCLCRIVLADFRVKRAEDVVKVGRHHQDQCIGIDDEAA